MTNNRGKEEEEEEEEEKKKGTTTKKKGNEGRQSASGAVCFSVSPFHESPLHFFVPFSPFSPHLSSFFTL